MKSFILMADVIDSTSLDGKKLITTFKDIVDQANKKYKNVIASPLTITLGDEFQGVISSLSDAIDIIFYLDSLLLKVQPIYKLRYVIYYGDIDTEINKSRSYEMLGEGLTQARQELQNIKKTGADVIVKGLPLKQKDAKLNLAFVLYRSIYNDWYDKDRELVYDFLEIGDYKVLAGQYKKDVSSMWRKNKSLKIEDFNASRELIKMLCDE